MNYFGFSDKGSVRGNNEDSFAVKTLSDGIIAAVVADGMGGTSGGEQASAFAVDFVIKSIDDASKYFAGYTDKQMEGFLKNMSSKLNRELYIKSNEDSSLSGMGTTLVVCIIRKNKYYLVNIGDSRLYVYSDSLNQITKDHSYVEELLEMGVITKEEAATHPNKNIITRAVGTENTVVPDFYKGAFGDNDVILICTDGLTNMVSDSDITSVLKSNKDAEKITMNLVEQANKNGGIDNITVVTVCNMSGGDQ